MSGNNAENKSVENLFSKYADLSIELHAKSDAQIAKLTESVNTLIQHNIEHKKDNEQILERQERLEQNQKEQGQEIRRNSDAILLLDRDSQSHSGYWKHVASVIVSVIAAAAIMLFK